ncbi:methyltransferase domain-containing protein [Planctomycetaceae bacterium SH139]
MSPNEPVQIGTRPITRDANAAPEQAVRERYSKAAAEVQPELCCPVSYDPVFLQAIPAEVLQRDYGCGDPSRYLRGGESVLDLGSGGGKICFIAAQVVGAGGSVLGVDMNDEMLALARNSAPQVAEKIGYANVAFHKAKIQDLALDRDAVDAYLRANPLRSESDLQAFEAYCDRLRVEQPLVPDASVDAVVSNCVLNLVDPRDKQTMFAELFRVLKPGGRAVISDIVSNQTVPLALHRDAELWSGCISGAYEETAFLDAFSAAGFRNLEIAELQREAWQVVEEIEFRSMTVIAYKPADEGNATTAERDNDEHDNDEQELIYRGPFAAVMDDAGQEFIRGQRANISPQQAAQLAGSPLEQYFIRMQSSYRQAADPEPSGPQTPTGNCGPGCC